MSLQRVELVSEVVRTCTSHALTTESEEIMGLLLGDTYVDGDISVCKVWRALPQIRTDRRKDRVEPSHQQLVRCVSKAEKITQTTGLKTRVVGWYHSHPKITVQPSHVDLRTQAQHQSLDPGFVGLIFSCFNGDQVLRCTAFQTSMEAPESPGGGETDPMEAPEDIDDEMKQALRMSLHEYKASKSKFPKEQLHHKEIPIEVVRPQARSEYSLMDLAQVHNILEAEESGAYQKAITTQKNVSNLIRLHQASVYAQGLITLMNGVLMPNLNGLLYMKEQNELNLSQLDKQIEHYKTLLEIRKSRSPSPVLGANLDAIPSLTRSTMDTLNDFIDNSTVDLGILGEIGPPSHPIETTKQDFGDTAVPTEVMIGSNEQTRKDSSTPQQRASQDGFQFDYDPNRGHKTIFGDQPGPSNYHMFRGNEQQHPEEVKSMLPLSQEFTVSPADQYIPFATFRTPVEAQNPPPSAFSKIVPDTEMTMFGTSRREIPQVRNTDNGIGFSAGLRKERPGKVEPQPEALQRLSVNQNKGNSQTQMMKVPRMNEFDDIWKDARDDVYKR